MSRHSCFVKPKLRKGLWSPEEDEKLLNHVTKYGHGCWSSVPKQAGLQRCGKSCRLRWINYLRPDLKRGTFSEQEENLIIELHEALGNKWSQIASQLPGRTDNEIKNLWNSCIKKKLRQRGIDPNTHKPLKDDKIPVGIENMLVTPALMAPTKELFSLEDPSPCLWLSHDEFNSNNVSSSSVPYNGNEMLSDNYSYDAGMYALNIEGGDEDLRWSEYLQGAFPVSATFNNQNQSMYSDVKTENQFALDELGNWQQSQQPQQLQNGEMYGKDFEIIPAVFGHI